MRDGFIIRNLDGDEVGFVPCYKKGPDRQNEKRTVEDKIDRNTRIVEDTQYDWL